MRFANVNGRLAVVLTDSTGFDLAASVRDDTLADPGAALRDWDRTLAAAEQACRAGGQDTITWTLDELGAPSPAPSQIIAVGLNYAPHAAESGLPTPAFPFAFTKTLPSLTGPAGVVIAESDFVDWEAELVVVIGRRARHVGVDDAWAHVAGVTGGQDISDREVQGRLGLNSQPTLGKSSPGFGPTGPFLVTPDEFPDRDAVPFTGMVNDEVVQKGNTSDLLFTVPRLVSYLSSMLELRPGDLIFTGTPEGTGFGRVPPSYLADGDVLTTTFEGIGTMRHTIRRVDRPVR